VPARERIEYEQRRDTLLEIISCLNKTTDLPFTSIDLEKTLVRLWTDPSDAEKRKQLDDYYGLLDGPRKVKPICKNTAQTSPALVVTKPKPRTRARVGGISLFVENALKLIERCNGNMSIAEAAKSVGCATSTLSRNQYFVSVYESFRRTRTLDADALDSDLTIRDRKTEGLNNRKRNG
jgi:hypothetical protein